MAVWKKGDAVCVAEVVVWGKAEPDRDVVESNTEVMLCERVADDREARIDGVCLEVVWSS